MSNIDSDKDRIVDKDSIIYNYFESNIQKNDLHIILRVYPFLKYSYSFIDLWKELYFKNKHNKQSKKTLLNLILIAISDNYLSIDRYEIKEVYNTITENEKDNDTLIVAKEIMSIFYNKEYEIIKILNSSNKLNIIRVFTDINVSELANELTLFCSENYKKIKLYDMLNMIIYDKACDNGPLQNLIKISEQLTYIVPFEILSQSDRQKQKYILEYFIKLAVKLKKRRNYHILFSIVLGLSYNCLNNIPHLWQNLTINKKFKDLSEFISYHKNYSNYRSELLENIKNPLIPCLSIINSDIKHFTEIELINRTIGELNTEELLNISNYIQIYQSFDFNFNSIESDLSIKLFLKNLPQDLDSKKIYELYNIHKLHRKGSLIEDNSNISSASGYRTRKSFKRFSIRL